MDKMHLISFVVYMLIEHKLGQSEFGSMIGIVKKITGAILRYIHSVFALIIKRGKL